MPVAYVDIPTGVNDGAKKKIFQELYEEIHEAWPIPDTRVLIREWPNEAVSQDGRIENVPMRPICTLAVPPGLEHDAKQKLVRQISNTIGEACGREVEEIHLPSGTKIYNNWILTFFWELPLDKVALGDLIATENPWSSRTCPRSNDAEPAVMLLEVLPFGAECWPRLPARTGDEAVRSSDPARRRRRVPALTRPGPCLDGQTPFGTSACRHRTGPCGLPCPTMGPATTPVTPRWGRASGTWPTDSPRSAAGARSGPPPASAQRANQPAPPHAGKRRGTLPAANPQD